MPEQPDMTTPINRADLLEVLELWGGALREQLRHELSAIRQEITGIRAEMATKQDLADLAIRQELFETTIRQDLVGMERRLSADLAHYSRSNADDLRREVALVDDKYTDLPERVAKLEAKRPARRRRGA